MATIQRTPLVDDDGTGTTGTPFNNAWQVKLYDAIDAALAAVGAGGITQLTADVLAGPGSGSQIATLASIVGATTVGDAATIPRVQVDTKGRISGLSAVPLFTLGPWTPYFMTDGGGSCTHSSQQGWYLKMGRLCIAEFYVAMSSKGTLVPGNVLYMAGLPVQAMFYGGGVMGSCNGIALPVGSYTGISLNHGAESRCSFSYLVAANPTYAANLTPSSITDTFFAVGTLTYLTV